MKNGWMNDLYIVFLNSKLCNGHLFWSAYGQSIMQVSVMMLDSYNIKSYIKVHQGVFLLIQDLVLLLLHPIGCPLLSLKNLRSNRRSYWRRIHPLECFTLGSLCPPCSEKGWRHEVMHRLTIIESGDYHEKVLPAKDRRPYGLAERGDNIFHDRSKV